MSSTGPLPVQKTLLDYVPTWLPVLIAILALISFGVRADADIKEIQTKVAVYDRALLERTDRMARVETELKNIAEGQARIERKLEEL